jgi:hypothetical protein
MKYQAGSVQIKLPLTLELGDRREIYIRQRERQSNKELKVQNKYKSSSKKFLRGRASTQSVGAKQDTDD